MAVVERLRCRSLNSIYSNQCYSIDVAGFAVAAPDVFKKVVILGDGARGAPSGAAGTILEPQLLNQRGFGLVKGKGEGVGELSKRLGAARQIGIQCAAAAFAAVGGLVADVLAVAVAGERHAQLDQLQEALGRERGLAQSNVTIHAAARKQRFGHFSYTVEVTARESQLVIPQPTTAVLNVFIGCFFLFAVQLHTVFIHRRAASRTRKLPYPAACAAE